MELKNWKKIQASVLKYSLILSVEGTNPDLPESGV